MLSPASIFQTVILAAGNGSRLAGGHGVPKPLMTIGGTPLLAHALQHARASGCVEAIVVVGHEAARVKAAVEGFDASLNVRFVESPDSSAPNGVSLAAAEPLAAAQFFLQMVDHFFEGIALSKLVAVPFADGEAGRVLIDPAPRDIDLDDATKVRLAADRVTAIGKGIDPWDAVDAGCFALTRAIFDALRRVPASEPRTVSSGMRQLVSKRSLGAVSVGSIRWADIDTPADLELAETLLQQGFPRGAEPAPSRI